MNTATMTRPGAGASPLLLARMTGVFWLMTAIAGTTALLAAGTRLGLAANLAATACYVAATALVYLMLRPVSRSVSMIAMTSSLLGCTVGILAGVLRFRAAHVPTLCFGLHCLLVGWLILRSTFLPRFVGVLMVCAGLGWLTRGVAGLVAPSLGSALSPWTMAAGITGELTLTLWLLVFGVDAARWKQQAGREGSEP
jgi:hypothetical protein